MKHPDLTILKDIERQLDFLQDTREELNDTLSDINTQLEWLSGTDEGLFDSATIDADLCRSSLVKILADFDKRFKKLASLREQLTAVLEN